MNGKKAKLMRKVGKGLTKKDKRLYYKLNHAEKGFLGVMYKEIIERNPNA